MATIGLVPGLVLGLVLATGACSSGSHPPKVTDRLEHSVVPQFGSLVTRLRTACRGARGPVDLELARPTITLRHRFSCATVAGPLHGIEAELVAWVADHNQATARADRVLRYAAALSVPVPSRWQLIWDMGTGESPTTFGCEKASDVAFRRHEIADAGQVGENPTHWLKVEAAIVAGECPDRLPVLYQTVITAGQPDAVANVRAELASLIL